MGIAIATDFMLKSSATREEHSASKSDGRHYSVGSHNCQAGEGSHEDTKARRGREGTLFFRACSINTDCGAARNPLIAILKQTGMPNPILFVPLCLRVSLPLKGTIKPQRRRGAERRKHALFSSSYSAPLRLSGDFSPQITHPFALCRSKFSLHSPKKTVVYRTVVRWCNGSTRPFGGFCPGSNPGRTAILASFFSISARYPNHSRTKVAHFSRMSRCAYMAHYWRQTVSY